MITDTTIGSHYVPVRKLDILFETPVTFGRLLSLSITFETLTEVGVVSCSMYTGT